MLTSSCFTTFSSKMLVICPFLTLIPALILPCASMFLSSVTMVIGVQTSIFSQSINFRSLSKRLYTIVQYHSLSHAKPSTMHLVASRAQSQVHNTTCNQKLFVHYHLLYTFLEIKAKVGKDVAYAIYRGCFIFQLS